MREKILSSILRAVGKFVLPNYWIRMVVKEKHREVSNG